eukprot:5490758-Pyramimonas_sp.AAC.2
MRGVPKWVWGTHAGGGSGASGGAPSGATKHVRGVPTCAWGTRAGGGTGAFGGAPSGATKLEGCAEVGVGDACGRWHCGLRWSSWATKRVR